MLFPKNTKEEPRALEILILLKKEEEGKIYKEEIEELKNILNKINEAIKLAIK